MLCGSLASVQIHPSPVHSRVVDVGVEAKARRSLDAFVVGHIEGHLSDPYATLLEGFRNPLKVPLGYLVSHTVVEGVVLVVCPVLVVPATGINPSGALNLVASKTSTPVSYGSALFVGLDDGNFLQKAIRNFHSLCLDAQGEE